METLRSLSQAEPFQPFSIQTRAGDSALVMASEHLALSSHDDLVVVFADGHRLIIINVADITAIST